MIRTMIVSAAFLLQATVANASVSVDLTIPEAGCGIDPSSARLEGEVAAEFSEEGTWGSSKDVMIENIILYVNGYNKIRPSVRVIDNPNNDKDLYTSYINMNSNVDGIVVYDISSDSIDDVLKDGYSEGGTVGVDDTGAADVSRAELTVSIEIPSGQFYTMSDTDKDLAVELTTNDLTNDDNVLTTAIITYECVSGG